MSQTTLSPSIGNLAAGRTRWPLHVSTRALDIAFAIAALALLTPVLLFIALAICIEDRGPILFFQKRLGRGGQEFVLWKFRKFRQRHGLPDCPLTLKHDPRLTRIGRLLERTKIDEVPQLWNILKGDMSVVGPRPETPHFADCFQGPYEELLHYRPGIFGPSQAVFRSESTYHETASDPEEFYRAVLFPLKARLDLAYYSHRRVRLDLVWAARCVRAVLGLQFMPGPAADLHGQVDCCLRLVASEAQP